MTYRWLFALVLAAACSKSDSAPPPPPGHITEAKPSKDPAKAKQIIAAGGALVFDVRTPDEFGDDHLASATNLPVDDLPKRLADVDRLAGRDKAKPIVVYCHAGGRAARAKQALEAAGYTNVTNGGGLADLR